MFLREVSPPPPLRLSLLQRCWLTSPDTFRALGQKPQEIRRSLRWSAIPGARDATTRSRSRNIMGFVRAVYTAFLFTRSYVGTAERWAYNRAWVCDCVGR